MLAQEAGVPQDQLKDIRWVEFSGGGDAVTQLMGGHLGAVLTDIGEIGGFIAVRRRQGAGRDVGRALQAYPDVATAKEQGDRRRGLQLARLLHGRRGIPTTPMIAGSSIMNELYESESWQKAATESGLTPIWRGGEEFKDFVRESEERRQRDLEGHRRHPVGRPRAAAR